jgi:hypothetical protein
VLQYVAATYSHHTLAPASNPERQSRNAQLPPTVPSHHVHWQYRNPDVAPPVAAQGLQENKISDISTLLNLPRKMTEELTFEKFCSRLHRV